MKIKRSAIAGTLESSDALIRIMPSDDLSIEIESPVKDQFGKQIEHTIRNVLASQGINQARVQISDKGALDCTLEARMLTAIQRAQED